MVFLDGVLSSESSRWLALVIPPRLGARPRLLLQYNFSHSYFSKEDPMCLVICIFTFAKSGFVQCGSSHNAIFSVELQMMQLSGI